MKQTAVEWLEEELKANLKKVILEGDSELMESLFKQAKEMEEQQKGYNEEDIAKAFDEGVAYETQGKLIRGKEWIKTHKKEWFEQFKNK